MKFCSGKSDTGTMLFSRYCISVYATEIHAKYGMDVGKKYLTEYGIM